MTLLSKLLVARLFEKQHLSREDRGVYRFEDDHFEEWIKLEHPLPTW
jgi:hypothetical protein